MSRIFKTVLLCPAFLCGLSIAACAPLQSPGYSTSDYESYNCNQLQAELKLVTLQYDQKRNEQQQKQIFNAALSLMGPSRTYDPSSQDDQQLIWLKQQQDVIQHMQIKKDCVH
jgi:hypothetical protein